MRLVKINGVIQCVADSYSLSFSVDKPFVGVAGPDGVQLADLFIFSSIHTLEGRDDTCEAGAWVVSAGGKEVFVPALPALSSQVSSIPGSATGVPAWEADFGDQEIVFSLPAGSSFWREKTYRFHCRPHRFTYEVEVEGTGHLCEVNYFGGYASCQPRWGSGFFWSGQKFRRGFNPEPNTDEVNTFPAIENSVIDLMGVPLPGKDSWFFTPPPFCFAFAGRRHWLSLGVEAGPGANRFTEYQYHGRRKGFFLSLSYEGHTQVHGRFSLPAIGFDFGRDEYDALEAHVTALQLAGKVPARQPEEKPTWWSEPIFCGWGAQCFLASRERGKAPDYARQEHYEAFLQSLEAHDVAPGIVVIDDKWQAAYGTCSVDEKKWPHLPGFIRTQHERGRKVLLWLKAWDPEGVPLEECILNTSGRPLAVDPTNLQYAARLRDSLFTLLSPSGLDADGFKIDFTARIPSGPNICTHGDLWGLELMKAYLQIIYTAAKDAKADALVMTHTPHPYLADVTDMIRLNDINMDQDVNQAMQKRAQVARIACPEAIIDTDNWPIKNKATWSKYLRLQPALGVPSLYFATHIDHSQEPLEAQDYELIRSVWARHRAKQLGSI